MPDAVAVINTWLFQVFTAEPLNTLLGGRVSRQKPESTDRPALAFGYLPGFTIRPVGPDAVGINARYQIRLWGREGDCDIEQVTSLWDTARALIEGKSFVEVVASGTPIGMIEACTEDVPLEADDVVDGVTFPYKGGLFTILAQSYT